MTDETTTDHPNIRVLLRVRPLNDRELRHSTPDLLRIDDGTSVHVADSSGYDSNTNNSTVINNGMPKSFTYDAVYGPESLQSDIYEGARGIVDAVCEGYNGTVVAYGQTGSGKTHTIFGDESQDGLLNTPTAGLVQRSLQAIYAKIASSPRTVHTTTRASFLEIYNERIHDLLSPDATVSLPLRESGGDVYVENLSEVTVATPHEAMDVLRQGMEHRNTAETAMNHASSRSHAVFLLRVRSEIVEEGGITKIREAKFTLVDLAGSERQKMTNADGERLKEANNINSSLLCLGQVIYALVDGRGKHAPYRDSKLTFLLRNSFGGNSKTCLVATVTPSVQSLSETLSTLKFAQRAKLIKNNAVLNENTCGSVTALQAEIARLKSELASRNHDGGVDKMGDNINSSGVPESFQFQLAESSDVTLTALRNQNSKLNSKLATLRETTKHRETQVTSLKRKLQQETFVRKCKERRIAHLSSKTETNESEELAVLKEEAEALRNQLENGQNTEAIEWMIKYKEQKAKVDEMEEGETTADAQKLDELESTIANLLNEKDALQTKLENMTSNQNGELDAILDDLTKLEKVNTDLKLALDEKTMLVQQQEERLSSNEVQLSELQEELKQSLECLEAAQSELSLEKTKSNDLQQSLEDAKKDLEDKLAEKNAAMEENASKMSSAEDQMKKLNETHAESTAALQNKITDLEEKIKLVTDENTALMEKMKNASEDITAKQEQLKVLQNEKEEMTKNLANSAEKETSYLDAFKLKEDEFTVELKELNDKVAGLISEKNDSADKLEKAIAENSALLSELESFKDFATNMEDEMMIVAEERNDAEAKLAFVQSDLERTLRLHHESTATMAIDHNDELASRDELINSLLHEKSLLKEELSNVSYQLGVSTAEHEEKAKALNDEFANKKEECEVASKKLEAVTSELEAMKDQRDTSVIQLANQEKESAEKISSLENQHEELAKELEAAKNSLSEHEGTGAELAKYTERVSELEGLIEELKAESDSLKAEVLSRDAAKSELDELKAEKEQLQSELDATNNERACINEEIELLKSKLKESEASDEQARSEVVELQAEMERLTSELDLFKSNEASANEELTSLKQQLDAVNVELSDLKEMSSAFEQETTEELAKLKSAKEELESERNELESNLTSAKEEAASLTDMLAALGKDFDSLKEESTASIELAKSEVAELQAEKDRLESECNSLKDNDASLKEKIEVLEQNEHSLKQESAASTEQSNSELAKLKAENERLESECSTLKNHEASKAEEVVSLEEKLELLEKDYTTLKAEHAASEEQTESELAELNAEKERWETQYNTLRDAETLKAKEVASLKEELAALEQKYSSLKDESTASSEKSKAELLELKAEKDRLESECNAMKNNEASKTEEVASLKDKLASLEKKYEAVDTFEPIAVQPPIDDTQTQDDNPAESTFMDDSFDEDLFLPNVDSPVQEEQNDENEMPSPSAKTEQNDENQMPSPSATPFKHRRALFSPKKTPLASEPRSKKTTTAKKPPKRATRSSKTPAQKSPIKMRVTRSRSSRTPLGNKN